MMKRLSAFTGPKKYNLFFDYCKVSDLVGYTQPGSNLTCIVTGKCMQLGFNGCNLI